jgi:hypothetical protein
LASDRLADGFFTARLDAGTGGLWGRDWRWHAYLAGEGEQAFRFTELSQIGAESIWVLRESSAWAGARRAFGWISIPRIRYILNGPSRKGAVSYTAGAQEDAECAGRGSNRV